MYVIAGEHQTVTVWWTYSLLVETETEKFPDAPYLPDIDRKKIANARAGLSLNIHTPHLCTLTKRPPHTHHNVKYEMHIFGWLPR